MSDMDNKEIPSEAPKADKPNKVKREPKVVPVVPKALTAFEATLERLRAKGKDVNALVSQVMPATRNNTGLSIKEITLECIMRPEGASIGEICLEIADRYQDGGLHITTVAQWLTGSPIPKIGVPVRKIGKGKGARHYYIAP